MPIHFFNMQPKVMATTSQVTPDEYMELFDKAFSSNQDLLYIVFRQALG